ncbi:MAG: LL-diaminopimelate aminotransferase [Methanothrix sp.]|jgi:LL-diaminopimelate aminotransferase|uniref:Aminotransferase n=1 Tax=Methanothrix harundinacea TaxID=301375 RepID=A0A124FMQ8_9EURY|nr:MAG: LL-diaminopimelate aminotransferase [Methanosaeta sp. SDB]KUK45536.1 MAG: LL-diaminopimelate aminotransferase apoenzyme [Methanothrix harundinacea]MDD3710616.1 LL-diaminopimelate aminotransferase [Methanothrix sp.]MDI9398177.1 LL-diaminopimelate aminotransferase [Euryarchaeota archaeon]KUK96765.1 MAG: LL-diaminopimelate aminotransferase apoenzyme [Methanothrix harundinacea]
MYSDRIKSLPPYPFAAIDRAKLAAQKRGVDVVDLGVGDPDLPTPQIIIDALCEAAKNPENHQYPSYEGKIELRAAVADWYKETFGVNLDPESEVLALIGSKEGIAHAPLAFLNPGNLALIPDPAYPVYKTAVEFAGGVPVIMPLRREQGFLPDLDAITSDQARKSRLIFLNYPNNPTGACADIQFFKKLVDFAKDNNLIVLHDNPYSEVYFSDKRPPSILEVEGAREVAVEFHSLSKTCNMTGWRVGFVVGGSEIIKGIGDVKSNIDSGNFGAVQDAGIVALKNSPKIAAEMRKTYKARVELLYAGLSKIGLEVEKPEATFYLWAWTGGKSKEYTRKLIDNLGIVATPGIGFGDFGEGYVRFSVTQPTERITEAVKRMEKMVAEERAL